ncbi:MAG: hypothetical protein DHS20C15_25610 [Planctomycetota bacterium]|nr:MAG: hypothetical protein DHS20C15_25610 [Planctomycetota bacterium]
MLRFALSTLALGLLLVPSVLADTHKVKKGDTIQSVIDAAGPSDTVVVPKGTYIEVLQIPDTKPGLKLIGKGVILDARPAGAEGSGAGITIYANDVTLSGFEIRHARNGSNPVGGNNTGFGVVSFGARSILQKLIVRGTSSDGIFTDGADCVVQKVVVQRAQGNGISVYGSGGVVDQALVERAAGTGIEAIASNVLVTRAEVAHCNGGIRIGQDNATVSKCEVRAVFDTALRIEFGQNVSVLNNRVDGAEFGIGCNADSAHIEGNDLRNLRIFGLEASGSTLQVVKNKVRGVSMFGYGILLNGGTVEATNNQISDVGGFGLELAANTAIAMGNRVQRAGSEGGEPAVYLSGDSLTASQNKILDSQGVAVHIDSSSDGLFSNNQIKGGLVTGIRVSEGCSQLTLANNTVSNVFGEGIQNHGHETALQGNKVNKTRTPITNDADNNASLIDQGGNKFGKGANAAGAPQPEIIE